MDERREIEVSFAGLDTFNYRIFQDAAGVHLDRARALTRPERVGYFLSLALAVFPLLVYLVAAGVMAFSGATLGWVGHVLALGFALAFLITVGYLTIEFERYAGSSLARDEDGALRLSHRYRAGRTRTYRLAEPAALVVLLDHRSSALTTWRNVVDPEGRSRREPYQAVVQVELEVHVSGLSPRWPLQPRRWIKWAPRYMAFYHRERNTDENIAATVAALRPLALAVRDSLGIPVEFRTIGGALVEQLEVAAEKAG